MEIRFESPTPPVLRSEESLMAFALALRSRPGEWALLGALSSANYARQRAYEIRNAMQGGAAPFFGPAGAFEAQSRSLLGECRVYVRFVGTAQGGTR